MSLKLLVIDDHPLVLNGITAALLSLGPDTRVLPARDAEEAMLLAFEHPDLDLVVVDLALPGGISGYTLITRLHERMPSLPVVVCSALDEPENVRLALRAGASGFVPKGAGAHALLRAVREVLEGNISVPEPLAQPGVVAGDTLRLPPDVNQLTPRQLEVLSGICHGKTNRDVALDLGLSEKTIKAHVTAIFKVLGVVNRTQAALAARRLGMLPS